MNIDNTKIQNLLYILYGFYIAKNNIRLTQELPMLGSYGRVFVKVFLHI